VSGQIHSALSGGGKFGGPWSTFNGGSQFNLNNFWLEAQSRFWLHSRAAYVNAATIRAQCKHVRMILSA